MKDFNYDAFLVKYKQMNTFVRENGIEHEINNPGRTATSMIILDKHLSSPGVAHGAAMAGYMDSVLGFCALSAVIAEGDLVSTVEFKLNYFKPIFKDDKLIGKGKVIRKGKSIVVSIAEIYRGEEMGRAGWKRNLLKGTFCIRGCANIM